MGERRFPFAAVAPMVADLTARQIAEIVDAKVNTVQRWRSVGVATIPETTAERLALWLDVYPETIWPDWFDDITRTCAECPATFVVDDKQPLRRYCSRTCQQRAWHREKYRTDPEHRERKKAAVARYDADAGRRARQRRKERARPRTLDQRERRAS